ncbi:MAG: response regulator [Xanthomonadales bacterium]|jgi:CheY-like chemotaxis protein|nr:response regulator [Xanthomonadales bacterium]
MTLQHLMVVEDDADIRRILDFALATFGGFKLTLCASGEAALAALEQERPDLILLDVMMPGMDGPSTLREIRARPALTTIPIIFLTAKLQSGEVASWTRLGALAVIAKPFDPLTLPDELRRIYADHAPKSALGGTTIDLPMELQALRPDFLARVHRDLDRLEILARQILECAEADACQIDLDELHSRLHGLAGAAGGFGYADLGNRCRALDQQSGNWLDEHIKPSLRDWHHLASAVLQLRLTLQ